MPDTPFFKKARELFIGRKGEKKEKAVDFNTLPKLLTIEQVSELFDVHPNTLRNWDKIGKLKALRVGARRDRRYDRDTIKAMYLKTPSAFRKESFGQVTQPEATKAEEPKLPPAEKSYVIQPGLSLEKVRLLFLSKRFSVFVYSSSLVAFTFLVLQVTFFAYIYMVRAGEKPPVVMKVAPTTVIGWEGAERAIKIDVLATAPLADFSEKNSAVYNNIPVVSEKPATEPVPTVVEQEESVVEEGTATEPDDDATSETVPVTEVIGEVPVAEEDPVTEEPVEEESPATNTNTESVNANTNTTQETIEESAPANAEGVVLGEEIMVGDPEALSEVDSVFEARDFMLPDTVPEDTIIEEAYVIFSFAADSYNGNEDVITLAYSIDSSTTWETLESTALLTDISNATNSGYWKYPISTLVDKEAVEAFAVRVTYHPVPAQESSTAYLDGVELEFLMIEPDDTSKEIRESVTIKKKDVTASENPVIEVNTKDKGFLGIGTKERTIKDFTVTDADGNEVKVEYELTEKEEKGKVISGYEIDTESLEKPGRYNVAMKVEQDGQIEEIKKEFTWSTLVLNTDQSVYKTGQPARFSLGAFDEYGGIICDADLELVITDPKGQVVTISPENGGIKTSEDCLLKGVAYEQADYEVSYITGVDGSYTAELKATYQGSTQSISRNFSAEITPSITIKRHGPTRVNPNELHTMTLEIISDQDFSGEIRERVPYNFSYGGSEDCNIEYLYDSAERNTEYVEIVCSIAIKKNTSNVFAYRFIPLRPETTHFDFGPTVIKGPGGDYSSQHKWDIFLKEGKVEKEILDKIAAGESSNIITKLRTAEKTVNIDQRDFKQDEKTGEYASGVVKGEGLDQLLASADVESISINQPVNVLLSESIPLIRADFEDSDLSLTGAGQKICVIDTGIDYNHPAIINYASGYDFINNDDDPFDDHGHGTQVAGVISAVAPGSEVYMAKVINEQGIGYESTVLAGLQWCIDQNVNIINFSIGSGSYDGFCDSNPVAELVNQAVEQGIFVTAATGNDGENTIKAPSCAFGSTRVSATDKSDNIADFANVNLTVDLFAPGSGVTVPALGGGFASSSGTSISAPMIAAGSALVLENEDLSPADLKYRLRSTGQPIEYTQDDMTVNISRLDVYGAVENNVTMLPYIYEAEQGDGIGDVYTPLYDCVGGESFCNAGSCAADDIDGIPLFASCTDCDTREDACSACCGGTTSPAAFCSSDDWDSHTWSGDACCDGRNDETGCAGGDPNGTACTTGSTCTSTYCVDTDATCGGSATCQDPGTTYDGFCCSDGATIWSSDGIITRTSASVWDCDKTEASLYLSDYYSDCDQSAGNGEQCDSSSLAGGYSVDGACAGTSTCCNTGGGNYPYGASKTDTVPDDLCAADPTDGRTCDHDTSDGSISLTGITTGTNDCCNGATYFSIGSTVTDATPWETCTTTCTNSRTCYDIGNISSGLADSEAGVCTADAVCSTDIVSLNVTDYVDGCATQDLGCDDDVTTAGYSRTGYCCASSCYVDGSRLETESCCLDANCEAGTTCVGGICTAVGIDISGIAYQEDELTAIDGTTVNKTVTLLVNGAATACGGGACTDEITDNTGAWSISTITAVSGDIITVYLDDETEEGTTVFVSDGTNQTNVNIFQNAVIVRHDTGTSITNANLESGDRDAGDNDIKFDVATGALTVDSEFELHIWTGDTYDPGGTVTTQGAGGDLHVDNSAIAYLDTATNTISAEITIDTGATLHVQETTNVNGTGSAVTVAGGTLNHTAGIFTIGNGTDEDMIITSGAANFSGGTTIITDELDINGGTFTISNTFNLTNTTSYFEVIGGTVNINAGADVNLSDRLYQHGDGSVINLNDGSVDSADYWLLYAGTLNFNGGAHNVATTQADGSLYFNGSTATGITFNMTGSGTMTTRELQTSNNARNFTGTQTGGTIIINGDNPTLGMNVAEATNDMNFYNIQISGTTTMNAGSTIDAINNFTIDSGQTLTTNGAGIPIDGDLIISSTGVMVAGASAITVGGNFNNSGTYTAGTSTVTMNGTGTLTSGGSALNNLTLSGTITLANETHSIGGDLDMASGTITAGSSTVTMTGASKTIIGGGATLYDLTIAGTITLQTSDLTVGGTLTVAADDALAITTVNLTHTAASDVAGTGNITGTGTLIFDDGSGGPGTTISTLSSIVRFDATAGHILNTTFDERTYGGPVEAYIGSAASAKIVTAPSGATMNFQSTLDIISSIGQTLYLNFEYATAVTVEGDVTTDTGTNFYAPATLTLEGNFTDDGIFTHKNGTVILAGTSKQTLNSFIGFYNLIITNSSNGTFLPGCGAPTDDYAVSFAASATISGKYTITTPGVSVEYNSGSTYTVSNGIEWTGTSGPGNNIYFRNSDLGSGTWLLNVSGTQTAVSYVDVGRSDAGGGSEIMATDGTNYDCGNNTNWKFAFNISGIAYTNEGVTPLDGSSVNKTVNLRVNGSGAYTDEITAADGAWQVTDIGVPAGSVVTVYLNDETEEATTVFISDASDQTNVDLYQGFVIVRADTGSITNANLSTGDDADDDIKYNVATGNLTVDSGFSLHVWTGDTFAPGGTVATQGGGDVHINTSAVFNAAGNNATVNGDWDNDGTFTHGDNTVTFDGTSEQTLSGNMTTSDFYNLTITNNSGSYPTDCAVAFTPSVSFVAAATISGKYTITTAGVSVEYLSGATYTISNGIEWTGTSGDGNNIYFRNSDQGSGTWLLNVSGTQTDVSYVNVARSDASSGDEIFGFNGNNTDCLNNTNWIFTITASGTSNATGTVKVAVNGVLQDDSDTIAGGEWEVEFNSVPSADARIIAFIESVDPGESTAITLYPGGNNGVSGMVLNFNVLSVGSSGDTPSLDQGDFASYTNSDNEDVMHNVVSYDLYVDGGNDYISDVFSILNGATVTFTGVGGEVPLLERLVAHDVVIQNGGILYSNGSPWYNIYGSWDNGNGGTLTSDGEKFKFYSTSSDETIDSGGDSMYDVEFNGSGGGWTLSADLTVNNNVTVTAGELKSTSANLTIINGGDLTGTGTVNMTGGTVSLEGSGSLGGNSNGWTFYNLDFTQPSGCVSGCSSACDYTTTVSGSGDMTITNVMDSDTCYYGGYGETPAHHILSAGTKTWIFTGSGSPVVASYTYDTSTFRYTYAGASTVTVKGALNYYNLELSPASGTPTYDLPSVAVYHDLTIDSSVDLQHGLSTLQMNGNGFIDAGGAAFYEVNVNGTSNTVTVQNSDFSTSNALQVQSNNTLSISSDMTVSHTGSSNVAGIGTISGAGTLRFPNGSGGPGTDISTLSSIVRYDASAGDIATTTFDARTYAGAVEAYADTANVRSVAMSASATQQIDGNLTVITDASQSQILTLDASANPTVNVGGNLSFTKGGAATPAITSGTGTWTVSGNVNLTNGTFTATAGHTLKMNGASKSITSASQTLQNYEVTGGSISTADALDVDGTFDVTTGTFTQDSNSNLNVAGDFTLASGITFSNATAGTGLLILDGDLTYTDSTSPQQDVGNVEIGTSPDKTDLDSDMKANSITINNGDELETDGFDLDVGQQGLTIKSGGLLDAADCVSGGDLCEEDETDINVTGDFDIQNGGDFDYSLSTLTFDDSSGTSSLKTDGAGDNYAVYNLVVNGGATLDVDVFDDTNDDNLVVMGDVTITQGELDALASDHAITVGGDWTNADTYTAQSNTVIFDGSSAAASTFTIDSTGATTASFYDLTFNDAADGDTFQLESTLDVDNDLLITGGTVDTKAAEDNDITIGHDWTNNDTFTAQEGTVTADGTSQQTFAGNMTSGTNGAFYDFTTTNATAASPDVIFSAAADTSNTFLANTASTQLQFNAGSTYTFQNIDFNGQAEGTRVFLRSSSTDTQWNLNVAGTRSVSNTNVRDSNACGQAPDINASDGTNFDATNNDCWFIYAITFSISDVSIGFGDLNPSAARWATGDATGSDSDSAAAHTISVSSNAANGYILIYSGSTLTSGSNTIPDSPFNTTIANNADGTPGTEEFAISLSTSGDATIATGYDHNATPADRDWKFVNSSTETIIYETGPTATELISAYYIANISSITESGDYDTNVTYIITSTF